MTLHVEVLNGATAAVGLRDAWERLAARDARPPSGTDVTSGPVWFEALCAAFGTRDRSKVVVVRDGETVVALLPVTLDSQDWGCRRLIVPTLLYGGRSGFLAAAGDEALLHAALGGVHKAFGSWQCLRLTLVEGSASFAMLIGASARHGYRVVVDGTESSPYFPLLGDAAAFNAGMSKGLRQTLRTGTNKLAALGELEFREFRTEEDVEWAIAAILAIDLASWKQEAGTAITCHPVQERFYRELFPRAARANLLYGQVALLEGKPIAFNFGLVHGGVFCCLKHSQTLEHQALSPGQLVNANMIDRLRDQGVSVYDFMGKVEPHKMRWSNANGVYACRQVRIFAPSLCGLIGHWGYRAKRWVRGLLRRDAPAAAADVV